MMKKLLPFTFALALCGFLLNGCEEDILSGDDPGMKAEVDGTSWEATSVEATGSNTITIVAAKVDGTGITLAIPGTATVGTHDLPSLSGYAATYLMNPSTPLISTSGSIEIEAISDTQVSGKFSFNATDGTNSVVVTDGTFVANRN